VNLSPAGMPADIASDSSRGTSFALAGLVHLALIAFLWIGVQWQSQTPLAVEAEVWDMTAREAAPLPVEPLVEPAPVEEVKVQPKVEEPPAVEDPELVLERKKIERLKQKKLEELEQANREAKRAQELAEKQKAEKLAKEELEKKKAKEAKDAKNKPKEPSQADIAFAERMLKLKGEAASAVGSGGTGTAPKSTGARGDTSYAARIAAIIRSNTSTTVTESGGKNITVTYRVYLLPDGSLRGAPQKMQSSGNLLFDEDVERGIRKSAPFPRNPSGERQEYLDIPYNLKETKQ
jgi:colicin import membrane protein